jgi:hypothetical protein
MNLDNSDVTDARSTSPQSTSSAAASLVSAKRAAFTAPRERGWVVAEQAGSTTLTRRHPLTVEGEDLGTIDVTFACGAGRNEYLVFYTETRRVTEGAAVPPLKSVELRLANKVVPLTLAAARPAQNPGERLASASGTVTATMLQNFASAGLRSIVIESASENADLAVIRIGNTGAAGNLTQFLTGCTQSPERAEHAGLQPEGGQ